MFLNYDGFRHYIEKFNRNDAENVVQFIDNQAAGAWFRENVPLFECSDPDVEETYYFRWWVFRKHFKKTPDGMIITEFHPAVPWAGKHNSIVCAAGHHLREGRWLRNNRDWCRDYLIFWFRKGGSLRSYSAWLADAAWEWALVNGDCDAVVGLLPEMVRNYHAWEESHRHSSGLFWSHDDRDAMEFSISGPGLRPTLNSYLYADARAIARIAAMAGQAELAAEFEDQAALTRKGVQEKLWDPGAAFFKVIPLASKNTAVPGWDFETLDPAVNVREEIGYIPWYFNLPEAGYEAAWRQLMDPEGFYAPYGPTTAERRHPRFMFGHEHECLWNGPSWPFATTQTLTALANLLNNYRQTAVTKKDYWELLRIYTRSHRRVTEDGTVINWLDENLDPFTGEWLARSILAKMGWRAEKGGRERGKDYNHSGYGDIIISGLVGLRPRADEILEINPLIPEEAWTYFCLDGVSYRGRQISVLYDKTGARYGKGTGLRIFIDGREAAFSRGLEKITCALR